MKSQDVELLVFPANGSAFGSLLDMAAMSDRRNFVVVGTPEAIASQVAILRLVAGPRV
jgi:hypothetical protein